jgi:phage terminase Nu1 subunit (DNA packaging protein)
MVSKDGITGKRGRGRPRKLVNQEADIAKILSVPVDTKTICRFLAITGPELAKIRHHGFMPFADERDLTLGFALFEYLRFMKAGLCSAQAAAGYCGVDPKRMRNLVDSGAIRRHPSGFIDLREAICAYADGLRREDLDRRSESTRKLQEIRIEEVKLNMATRQKELVPIEEAKELAVRIVGEVVSRLVGLPARVTRDLGERNELNRAIDAIRREVAEIIAKYADGLPDAEGDDDSASTDVAG